MAENLSVTSRLEIPGAEIQETASRARGPGGQHVNKTSTRVTLRWSLEESEVLSDTQRDRLRRRLASRLTRRGSLVVHADATRSRTRNRALARERLAALVREGLATHRPRRATRPGAASREKRIQSKKRRGQVKQGRGRVRDDN